MTRTEWLAEFALMPAVQTAKQKHLEWLDLRAGERVLDAGSGPGFDVEACAVEVGPEGLAVGVDLEPCGPPGSVVRADACALPFADQVFHAARCERLLVHLDDPLAVILEMVRVLAPGGRLTLAEPDFGSLELPSHGHEHAIRAAKLRAFPSPRVGWELEELAAQAGLRVVQRGRDALVIEGFATADRFLGLTACAVAASRDGLIRPVDAARWIRHASALGPAFRARVQGHALLANRARLSPSGR